MHTTKALAACLAIGLSLASANAWTNHSESAVEGPYKVVMSKPIVTTGMKVGELYEEHEYLTAMWNQLDKDGHKPVMTEILSQPLRGAAFHEVRMVVVCVRK